MLPTPEVQRTPLHTRTLSFRGFARADGLWDMEGELHDSKHYDHPHEHGTRHTGQPVHHLFLRVTLDEQFCIRDIATRMGTAPFAECGEADRHMRRFIGQTMGKGWRQTIERTVGGLEGCTHLRELLFNMATAAFQTIPHHMEMQRLAQGQDRHAPGAQPPFYMGRCMTWDFNGPVVARLAPQFVHWKKP
jgi:hypothetical protein